MPAPTRTETLNTFIVSTGQNRRPGLVDSFFGSMPLLAFMRRNQSVELSGGSEIRENFVYNQFAATSYGRGDTFDTGVTEFSTSMVFDWKFTMSPINLNVIDIDLNDSPERTFDIVSAAMDVAELSLQDDASDQLFADGTGNAGKDMDGLANAVSRSTSVSYGGITRSATAGTPGNALLAGADDSTGGTLSLANVNAQFGSTVVAREKPNLVVTTQALYNRIWERVQPSDRYPNAPEDRDIGFETCRFNGAYVTVDSHVPSGFLYMLNTDWWKFYIHRKWDFRMRGPMEPTNQQLSIAQLILWGNAICRAPRFQGVMSGLS